MKYRHYKSKFYEFIGITYDSETLEESVVYKALYHYEKFGKMQYGLGLRLCFFEKWNGKLIPRFEEIQ